MGSITAAIGVGWVVSPVISLVINKIESHIEKKYFKNSETGKHLKELHTSLKEIHAIMVKVEKQRIENDEQLQLVQGIKDAIYEAEDVVTEFEYNLEKPVEQQKLDTGASGSSFTDVALSLADTFREKRKELSEYLDWPILGDTEFKKKVKEVSESLVLAKGPAETLLKLMNINKSPNIQSPEQENELDSSSQIGEKIIGRTKESRELIELLFKENNETPTIIQIVGQGGIGKTSLARLVYNDPKVVTEQGGQGFFELKMWLNVSEIFDGIKLTKQMVKCVNETFSLSDTSFDLLQKELKEKLASKRILLVLDNVWYPTDVKSKSSFEQNLSKFLAPLEKTKPGSKIIVTTREGAVETTLESFGSLEVITLDGLNDADSWSLLKLKAFGRKNQHNRHNLEPIGEELVKNLNGFPLAIRVVATELRGKAEMEEWKTILNENVVDRSDITGILLRSYDHLPDYLQPCFAYCSLFPKGYHLKPNRLIHMWIAQGFVHARGKKSPEEIGKSYFDELIDRSLIQKIKEGNKEYYMMHDLMNDLACHVSHGECRILKEGDTLENLGSVRHLSVTTKEHARDLVKICGLDKLRTLLILLSNNDLYVEDKVFIEMKKIRVLDIDCYFYELPNIGECKFLRYLCFRNCESQLAPDTFSKLHLLTVLIIRKILYTKRRSPSRYDKLAIPQSIPCMSKSKIIIDTSKSIIMELGGHVQLHSVWRGGPAVFEIKKKDGWELSHLGDFNNIKGILKIRGLQNVASKDDAIKAQLDSKEHVTNLRLKWDGEVESNIEHNEIVEALRPHQNIKRLTIQGFPGDKFPSWLESNWLSRLTYLGLGGYTSGFKMLPALGQIAQLKELFISKITTVSRIGDEFYRNGVFPSLKELRISEMKGLKEWSSPLRDHSFPKLRRVNLFECPDLLYIPTMESFCSLESVEILDCPKIKKLPKLPISLRVLKVGFLNLRQFNVNDIFPSLEELQICCMEGLEEWSSPCEVNSFPKLFGIVLQGCPNLFSLPIMESFFSLRFISIGNCPKLKSLPKLPVSLQHLHIANVHPNLEEQLGNKNGPEWDKVAAVPRCRCVIDRDGPDGSRVVLQEGEKIEEQDEEEEEEEEEEEDEYVEEKYFSDS